MLVLTRKPDQAVQIGDDVKVVVLDINRNQVKLGFMAPDSVTILRTELVKRNGNARPILTL